MRLELKIGNTLHWVELDDDIIWTRALRKQWWANATDDEDAIPQLQEWITGMHLVVDDDVFEDAEELTPELLDRLHPAVIRFLYRLPEHAAAEQANLGNVSGGR